MSRIAFLGLGAMGSRMATQLLSAGHELVVWNRNPEKTDALRAAGAEVAASPRAAAAGAEFVLAMVRDDEASREIWLDRETGALASIRQDAVAIECSTLGLQWVAELSVRCKAGGVAFLDAPLAGSRPQAEQRQLIFFVGGDPEVFARAEPILKAMGAAIHHAGLNGAGALTKLVANALFGIQVATIAELIETVRRRGVDPRRVIDVLAATPVLSPAAKGAAGSMLQDAFAPLFPVELVEKDLSYALAAAGSDAKAPIVTAARGVFAEAMRNGYGGDNLTGVVRLYRN